jgi:hypothetical protein
MSRRPQEVGMEKLTRIRKRDKQAFRSEAIVGPSLLRRAYHSWLLKRSIDYIECRGIQRDLYQKDPLEVARSWEEQKT